MFDPGLNLHEWTSEMAALEDELRDSPAEALSELDALLRRMLEESGYDVGDAVVREGDEREVVADYLAAHEIAAAVERDDDSISPGDVAAAVNDLRELFDYLVASYAGGDEDLGAGV